jgi:hypothetical protein
MNGAWINCKNCGYRYGSWISSCPKCGSANSSYKGVKGKGGFGKKIAIGGGIGIAALFSLILVGGMIGGGGTKADLQNSSVPMSDPSKPVTSQASGADNALVSYALEKINQDRAKAGLTPVKLSSNAAAEAHAEDILKTRQLSHWMTNGEKPYMTYTRYGGMGDVSQNAAISNRYLPSASNNGDSRCAPGLCQKIDPNKVIDELEHSMVYDDLECCSDGHKHNILDKYHTDVNIGVAHDDYTLVLVQNFENNYIQFNKPIIKDAKHIQLAGKIPSGKFGGIDIFYDKTPTPSVYEDNKARREYGLGQRIASVVEPWWMKQYQKPSDYVLISSDNWSVDNGSMDVTFDISQVMIDAGVYTVVTSFQDNNGNSFSVTNYSIFYDGSKITNLASTAQAINSQGNNVKHEPDVPADSAATTTNVFDVYKNAEYGISVEYPYGWYGETSNDGSQTRFSPQKESISDKDPSLFVTVIRLSSALTPEQTLEANLESAKKLSLNVTHYERITLSGQPAYRLEVESQTGEKGIEVVTTKDKQGYMLTYRMKGTEYSKNLPIAQHFFDSFKFLPQEGRVDIQQDETISNIGRFDVYRIAGNQYQMSMSLLNANNAEISRDGQVSLSIVDSRDSVVYVTSFPITKKDFYDYQRNNGTKFFGYSWTFADTEVKRGLGAGTAKLTFITNDGKSYSATFSGVSIPPLTIDEIRQTYEEEYLKTAIPVNQTIDKEGFKITLVRVGYFNYIDISNYVTRVFRADFIVTNTSGEYKYSPDHFLIIDDATNQYDQVYWL